MVQAKLFMSNNVQAVRLPKSVAMSSYVERVNVVVQGRARICTPADDAWDGWFEGENVTADFTTDREQPAHRERESF